MQLQWINELMSCKYSLMEIGLGPFGQPKTVCPVFIFQWTFLFKSHGVKTSSVWIYFPFPFLCCVYNMHPIPFQFCPGPVRTINCVAMTLSWMFSGRSTTYRQSLTNGRLGLRENFFHRDNVITQFAFWKWNIFPTSSTLLRSTLIISVFSCLKA